MLYAMKSNIGIEYLICLICVSPSMLTAHKPHGCFFVASCFSFRKNIILAERSQLVSPPRRSMRETLCNIIKKLRQHRMYAEKKYEKI